MKKVIFFVAIVVAGFLLMPKESKALPDQFAVIQMQDTTYMEIQQQEVPEAVLESLDKEYSGFLIDKAYRGNDGSFKLVIKRADIQHVVFYTEEGQFIKVTDESDKD